ncbi:hypothetical protein KGM_203129 [Danaus plexippus plexippus]|uniref:Salivary glue protein Sgs-3-like n=1 Tax=Danaus plexippus plexippus TaxID=278856 RepID=A0A212FHQ6_DANPL|nr:hypothetical protein KGM_203129 [Danaus plexippus plexippus]
MTSKLFALVALAALAAVHADPPRPRLIDFNPWSWIPSNRNKSPSIMDYFFPPSRTPKNSNLDPPADRQPPTVFTIQDNTPTMTTIQERPTTVARKSHNKIKTTVSVFRPTATAPPKTKKSSQKHVATDTTIEIKTTPAIKTETFPPTTTTVTSSAKPPKRYSIKPVRTTETPTVQDTESTVNVNSDSTETVIGTETSGTTAEITKETAVTSNIATETRTTDSNTGTETTIMAESTVTEPADSREGYLPLRDKPHQTHVKINEQTNKEKGVLRKSCLHPSILT